MNVTIERTKVKCSKIDKNSLWDAFSRIEMRDADVKSIAVSADLHKRLEDVLIGNFSLRDILKTDTTLPNGVAILTPDKEDVLAIELIEVEEQPPTPSTW
jgi:hypothetical protein